MTVSCTTLCLIFFLLWLSADAISQPTIRLNYQQSRQQTIEAGDTHFYTVELKAGEVACIEISYTDSDIDWWPQDAQGQLYPTIEDIRAQPPHEVLLYSVTDATYQICLKNPRKNRGTAYHLNWKGNRLATERDKLIFNARQTELEAVRLYNDVTREKNQQSIEKCQLAISLYEPLGNIFTIGEMYNLIGLNYLLLGERALAEQAHQQALAIFRQLHRRDQESNVIDNLSRLSLAWGDYQVALNYASQALTIARQNNDLTRLMSCFSNLADIYSSIGEFTKAIDMSQESIKIAREHPEIAYSPLNEVVALLSLSNNYFLLGDEAKGTLYLEQGLVIYKSGVPVSIRRVLVTQIAQAVSYIQHGQPNKALAALQSISVSEHIPPSPRVQVLVQLGKTYVALKHFDEAAKSFQQAEEIAKNKNFQNLLLEIRLGQMQIAQARQQIDEAIHLGENAITTLEQQSTEIYDYVIRTSLLATQRAIYELQTDLLLQRSIQIPERRAELEAAALQISERGRARTLLNLLNMPQISAERMATQQKLRAKLEQAASAYSETPLANRTQKEELKRTLTLLTAELNLQYTNAKNDESKKTDSANQALPLPIIQQQLLDENTLLLEFSLGAHQSYLFAATRNQLKVFLLPPRIEIERQARALYQTLEERVNPPVFTTLEETLRWKKKKQRQYQLYANQLSAMLLAPVRDLLTHKRLLIVPDGALHYVPFAALPELQSSDLGLKSLPGAAARKSKNQPLIVSHEILTLPSASTLAVQRTRWKNRALAPQILAVFADPIFNRDDPRLASRQNSNTEARPVKLERLPASRLEAENLLSLVPASARMVALDYDANLTTATSDILRQYRYVHFATHGLVDNDHPELSSLVFSQWNAQGRAINGHLRVLDIFELQLNAELVVLSGCHTGVGKEITGEGFIGLSRGFMQAGAKRVMASLWQVNDVATAQLMRCFYERLLHNPKLQPAAALRDAQLELYQSTRWHDPIYWAAFTLQGEW